ncbi:MAG: molybdopterin-synthase adenylyltransferase MoeB [Myxococcota bacterium]
MSESSQALTHAELSRYSRHLLLPQVGSEGQQRLKAASVLVVGAGGLGSPVLEYLTAAGVGHLLIADDDRVELSNLQRQVLHSSNDLGTPKVASAAARLHSLNPHVHVETHQTRVTRDNVLDLVQRADVVVDATDNFQTRYLLNDACVMRDKPLVYGAIYRFEGQASVFNHNGGPNYRDLFPEPPPAHHAPNCAEAGVLGVLPAVIGSIQATETLKILLGIGSTLSGRLVLYHALDMTFREFGITADPATRATTLTDTSTACAAQDAETAASITPQELVERLHNGWAPFIIDVRSAAESTSMPLPRCDMHCRHDQIVEARADLPPDRDLLLVCQRGQRSVSAVNALHAAGQDRLLSLTGGVLGWAEALSQELPST